MLSVWVKGYKPEEKEKRKSEVLGYRNAFDDLKRDSRTGIQKKRCCS